MTVQRSQPMTDLPEQLDHYAKRAMPHYPNDICSLAKCAIERLTERCEAYKQQVKDGAEEIERLKVLLRRVDEYLDGFGYGKNMKARKMIAQGLNSEGGS